MTVAELIGALAALPADLPVEYIDTSYGRTDVVEAGVVPARGDDQAFVWLQG
jgi:hypothetical protein